MGIQSYYSDYSGLKCERLQLSSEIKQIKHGKNVTVVTDHIKTVVLTYEMLHISKIPQKMNSVLYKCDIMD